MAVTHEQATVSAFLLSERHVVGVPKRKVMRMMKTTLSLAMLLFATMAGAQGKSDEAAIRSILQEEVTAWNKGDAQAYSQYFAADGTFTNIRGMFFTGHQAFLDRHEEIFKGMFRGTVVTLTSVSGFSASGPPPGTPADAKGRLRTRLLQVMVKDAGEWKITVYHNVDIKPGVTAPEPE